MQFWVYGRVIPCQLGCDAAVMAPVEDEHWMRGVGVRAVSAQGLIAYVIDRQQLENRWRGISNRFDQVMR